MSAMVEQEHLAEEICALYSRLTGGKYEEDMPLLRRMAEEEEPHDHWLRTNKLDYASRVFLCAATAFFMHYMKGDGYKCAVLTRSVAETFAREAETRPA